MLTIPQKFNARTGPRPSTVESVIVLGRSEKVLGETVALLRADGHLAGATNDFDHVLALFDATWLTIVVFGGMVPLATKEGLRRDLAEANPSLTFVQGLAGIPGLVASQVQAATRPSLLPPGSIAYDPGNRAVSIALSSAEPVRVIAFWGTAFVAPDPESTSEVIFSGTLEPGTHAVAVPPHVPDAASFVVVHVGPSIHPLVVGEMPPGTTLAAPR